jgi:ubiquinone/menaquinone biosynthesis C-methylase UbiE
METDERKVEETVKEWFKHEATNEWRRLQRDPYRQIEFMVTMHFLERHLPKRGLILDSGGGPGRYSIELARRGYNVVLLDLVPEMLRIARKKAKQAGVLKKINQFVEGSIGDLSEFPDEKFDAVLCLGGP